MKHYRAIKLCLALWALMVVTGSCSSNSHPELTKEGVVACSIL